MFDLEKSKPQPPVVGTLQPLALRRREAAKLMGISERWLQELTNHGDVPHVRIGSGKRPAVLYLYGPLKAWLASKAS
jgi:excisionase family DNA binding protein